MGSDLVVGSLKQVAKKQGKEVSAVIADAILDGTAKIVIVDVSASMGNSDASEGQQRIRAAQRELERLQEQYPGEIILVEFSSSASFRFDGKLSAPNRLTNLISALALVEEYDGLCDIWVITDGEDLSIDKCLQYAKTHKSKINTVFMGTSDPSAIDFLKNLSRLSGGQHAVTVSPGMLAAPVMGMLPPPKVAINL